MPPEPNPELQQRLAALRQLESSFERYDGQERVWPYGERGEQLQARIQRDIRAERVALRTAEQGGPMPPTRPNIAFWNQTFTEVDRIAARGDQLEQPRIDIDRQSGVIQVGYHDMSRLQGRGPITTSGVAGTHDYSGLVTHTETEIGRPPMEAGIYYAGREFAQSAIQAWAAGRAFADSNSLSLEQRQELREYAIARVRGENPQVPDGLQRLQGFDRVRDALRDAREDRSDFREAMVRARFSPTDQEAPDRMFTAAEAPDVTLSTVMRSAAPQTADAAAVGANVTATTPDVQTAIGEYATAYATEVAAYNQLSPRLSAAQNQILRDYVDEIYRNPNANLTIPTTVSGMQIDGNESDIVNYLLMSQTTAQEQLQLQAVAGEQTDEIVAAVQDLGNRGRPAAELTQAGVQAYQLGGGMPPATAPDVPDRPPVATSEVAPVGGENPAAADATARPVAAPAINPQIAQRALVVGETYAGREVAFNTAIRDAAFMGALNGAGMTTMTAYLNGRERALRAGQDAPEIPAPLAAALRTEQGAELLAAYNAAGDAERLLDQQFQTANVPAPERQRIYDAISVHVDRTIGDAVEGDINLATVIERSAIDRILAGDAGRGVARDNDGIVDRINDQVPSLVGQISSTDVSALQTQLRDRGIDIGGYGDRGVDGRMGPRTLAGLTQALRTMNPNMTAEEAATQIRSMTPDQFRTLTQQITAMPAGQIQARAAGSPDGPPATTTPDPRDAAMATLVPLSNTYIGATADMIIAQRTTPGAGLDAQGDAGDALRAAMTAARIPADQHDQILSQIGATVTPQLIATGTRQQIVDAMGAVDDRLLRAALPAPAAPTPEITPSARPAALTTTANITPDAARTAFLTQLTAAVREVGVGGQLSAAGNAGLLRQAQHDFLATHGLNDGSGRDATVLAGVAAQVRQMVAAGRPDHEITAACTATIDGTVRIRTVDAAELVAAPYEQQVSAYATQVGVFRNQIDAFQGQNNTIFTSNTAEGRTNIERLNTYIRSVNDGTVPSSPPTELSSLPGFDRFQQAAATLVGTRGTALQAMTATGIPAATAEAALNVGRDTALRQEITGDVNTTVVVARVNQSVREAQIVGRDTGADPWVATAPVADARAVNVNATTTPMLETVNAAQRDGTQQFINYLQGGGTMPIDQAVDIATRVTLSGNSAALGGDRIDFNAIVRVNGQLMPLTEYARDVAQVPAASMALLDRAATVQRSGGQTQVAQTQTADQDGARWHRNVQHLTTEAQQPLGTTVPTSAIFSRYMSTMVSQFGLNEEQSIQLARGIAGRDGQIDAADIQRFQGQISQIRQEAGSDQRKLDTTAELTQLASTIGEIGNFATPQVPNVRQTPSGVQVGGR